jgi:hypothetical protein
METELSKYYRLPVDSLGAVCSDRPTGEAGFFNFGSGSICYGQCGSGPTSSTLVRNLYDASKEVHLVGPTAHLPFDFSQIVENLRRERYREKMIPAQERLAARELVRRSYYLLRGIMPVSIRRHLQRAYFADWREIPFPAWPVDFTVDSLHEELLRILMKSSGVRRIPFIWFWPNGAPNCFIMTHDVETSAGRDFSSQLMNLDDSYGIKASFQVIPEKRYEVPADYVLEMRGRGFEFNIHDLNHDGHLYRKRDEFLRRAKEINSYVRRYSARGFRAGAMYRNQDWYDVFEFSYDMSVPNVAHLEPMRGGCCTVMPYFVGKIVELPLTTLQDYSVFHILNEYSIDIWKTQLNLIRRKHGLMSFITHPDYLIERRCRKVFEALLDYLRQIVAAEKIWAPLPGEVDRWWRDRDEMKLLRRGNAWEIVGPQSEKARVAHAVLDGDRLVYEIS